jgi:hypothetical protein
MAFDFQFGSLVFEEIPFLERFGSSVFEKNWFLENWSWLVPKILVTKGLFDQMDSPWAFGTSVRFGSSVPMQIRFLKKLVPIGS